MKKYVLLTSATVLTLLCLVPSHTRVQAQQTQQMGQMDMSVAPENVIDGSVQPEKITDRDAYKMFLISATLQYDKDGNLLPGEVERQKAVFNILYLTDDQLTIATQIVNDFGAEFQAANAAWDAAHQNSISTPSEEAAYRKQIRGLVNEAMDKFDSGLGADRSHALNEYIQDEKKKMRIAVED